MHELRLTHLFNQILGGAANALLNAIGYPAADPRQPWTDWLVCEVIVFVALLIFFAIMRGHYSVDKPGKVQHILELLYSFFHSSAEEVAGHDGPKHLAFFGTIFIYILCLNLVGLIPGFASPTQWAQVPLAFAAATFLYYHFAGLRANGAGYVKQFLGPIWWLVPLMVPIEIISHFARPLSLTLRLYANMFAGEQVYLTFVMLTKLLVPVIFIFLHTFVSLLQAYIFMLLAMVYVGGAISHEH